MSRRILQNLQFANLLHFLCHHFQVVSHFPSWMVRGLNLFFGWFVIYPSFFPVMLLKTFEPLSAPLMLLWCEKLEVEGWPFFCEWINYFLDKTEQVILFFSFAFLVETLDLSWSIIYHILKETRNWTTYFGNLYCCNVINLARNCWLLNTRHDHEIIGQ